MPGIPRTVDLLMVFIALPGKLLLNRFAESGACFSVPPSSGTMDDGRGVHTVQAFQLQSQL